jgi:hypothetical protein
MRAEHGLEVGSLSFDIIVMKYKHPLKLGIVVRYPYSLFYPSSFTLQLS